MKIDSQSRMPNPVPEQGKSSTAQTASTTNESVTPTTQQVFSASHIPGTNALPPQAMPMPHVEAHKGMGIFDRNVFSKSFAQAHQAALSAIKNPDNQAYLTRTGHLLPDAKSAVDKFVALVATKSASTTASAAARNAFAEGPLNEIETYAWQLFVKKLPPTYTAEFAPVTAWKNVETQELRDVLMTEPGFARFMNRPEGAKFVNELKNAINEKGPEMLSVDKGMALVFRFDSAYSAIAHTALASLWRDESGQLCMGIAHQESVPPSDPRNDVPRGVVYDKFDTSSTFPGGHAPVVESMKLTGLPAVNVFPCPHPEAIVPAVMEIAGEEKANPYGATDNWRNNNRGQLPSGRPFETCFNVTHKVLAQLYGVRASQAPLMPNVLMAMRPFVSIPANQFNTVTIPAGKEAKAVELVQIAQQPAEDIVKTFVSIGEKWGLSGSWDVRGQSRSSKHSLVLTPGQTGIVLPQGARNFKFISDPGMLKLNGRPVRAGVAFTAEDAAMMVYEGKENSRPLLYVAAVPERAKL
jgi:hypothetical protein